MFLGLLSCWKIFVFRGFHSSFWLCACVFWPAVRFLNLLTCFWLCFFAVMSQKVQFCYFFSCCVPSSRRTSMGPESSRVEQWTVCVLYFTRFFSFHKVLSFMCLFLFPLPSFRFLSPTAKYLPARSIKTPVYHSLAISQSLFRLWYRRGLMEHWRHWEDSVYVRIYLQNFRSAGLRHWMTLYKDKYVNVCTSLICCGCWIIACSQQFRRVAC